MMNQPKYEPKPKLLPWNQLVDLESSGKDGKVFKFQVYWNGVRAVCSKCGSDIGFGLSARNKFIPFNLDGSGKVHWSCEDPLA